MHNYSTPYAVNLLKNLVPALKPGARIVINDHCLREPGSENPWDEKIMRGMDMVMLTLLNAQERHENEFKDLFAAADERFVFKARHLLLHARERANPATGRSEIPLVQDERGGGGLESEAHGEWRMRGVTCRRGGEDGAGRCCMMGDDAGGRLRDWFCRIACIPCI
ncbi:hypothetical protein E4U53_006683 [Claviceps sorghi]|nr:hypothetical protein E4U53_006683 [Claviceps sorghi]